MPFLGWYTTKSLPPTEVAGRFAAFLADFHKSADVSALDSYKEMCPTITFQLKGVSPTDVFNSQTRSVFMDTLHTRTPEMKIYHETILKALILLVEHGLVYGIHTKPSVVQVDGHKRQYAWDELLFGLQEDIWMPVLEEVHAKTPLKTYDIQYNNFYMFREGLYNSIAMYMRSANTCMNYTMEGCESFHRILEEMKTEMAGLSAQLVSRPAESFHHMVEDMRTEMEATKEELSALKAQLASRPADTFATYSVPIVPIAKEEHVDRHVPTPSRGETAAPISEPESKNDHYIGISLLVLVLALAVNLYCQNEILTPLRLQLSSY